MAVLQLWQVFTQRNFVADFIGWVRQVPLTPNWISIRRRRRGFTSAGQCLYARIIYSKLNLLILILISNVDAVVEKTARSLYALKTIRAHSLDGNALWDVTQATVVAQLLYASPAWWGFLKADEKSRLQSVINKAQRYRYLPTPFRTMDELRQELDETLFHSSRYNPHHVLHRLLPQRKDTGHNLRQRAHNLTLHSDVSSTAKQNFIPRMLFADMYWCLLCLKCIYICYCVCCSPILVYILYYL